jgi:transcriptional regulator with XRE-family HTH domain
LSDAFGVAFFSLVSSVDDSLQSAENGNMMKRKFDSVDISVGSRVRLKRLEIGMSQAKLGESIGLTFQQVQKYENGSNRIGSSRMMQIANALGVSPSFFFEGGAGGTRTKGKDTSVEHVSEFVRTTEGLTLVRAFTKVPKGLRRSIVNLVEKIAEHE